MKRFDPIGRPYTKAMITDDLGNYVLYSDYEKLEVENKKLKQSSSILNSLSDEKPCPVCNNKMDYQPRIYHCKHCGSDFN